MRSHTLSLGPLLLLFLAAGRCRCLWIVSVRLYTASSTADENNIPC